MAGPRIIGRGVEVQNDEGKVLGLGVVYRAELTQLGMRYHVSGFQRRYVVPRSQLRVLGEPWPHTTGANATAHDEDGDALA